MFSPKNRFAHQGMERIRIAAPYSAFVAALALALGSSSAAFGQLRSGKVERQLYQPSDAAVGALDGTTSVRVERGANDNASSSQPSNPLRQQRIAASSASGRPLAVQDGMSRAGEGGSARPRQRQAVVSASYASIDEQGSILEPVHNPATRMQEVSPVPLIEPQARMMGSAPAATSDYLPFAGRSGSHMHSDCGCDSCGHFSQIAPTCASACPPGSGPLMALWYRLRIRGETPLYWRRAAGPPPLVTTSPVGTDSGIAGELGQGATSILLGGGRLNEDLQLGGRITVSTWLDPAEEFGLQARYWNAGDQDDIFRFDSSTNAILARPFFNTSVAGDFENDTQLVSFPGDLNGNLAVESTSSVQGLEIQLRRRLYQDRFTRVDWISGYQHVSIDEGLVISSTSSVIGTDNMISVRDSFFTDNSFHGGSYGFISTRNIACWKMETMFRLGLGNLRREVSIAGSTTTSGGGQTNTVQEGLLARNTNSRNFVDDTFIVIPEVGFTLAYNLRPGWDFTVGYNYMFIPKVAQASQQIDDSLAVNLSSPLTGELDPGFTFDERNYWLHSLGLGLQVRY